MKKVAILSLMLVAVMALFIPVARAQEDCYNLSEADCAYLNAAVANTATVTSFVQKFSLSVDVTGLASIAMFDPSIPASFSFAVAGEGPVVVDPSGEGFPLSLSLPMSATVDGQSGDVLFAVVDNMVYLGIPGETVGIPLDQVLGAIGMSADPTSMTPTADSLGLPAEFVNFTRGADVQWMGMSVSPFVFSFDGTSALRSIDVGNASMLAPLLGDLGSDPSFAMVMAFLPDMLQGIELTVDVTQYVGTDNYIHKLTFDFVGAVDMDVIFGALMGMGGTGQSMGMGKVDIVINFDVELTSINEALTVSAPEGARILTEAEIQALLGGLGGMLP